MPLRLTPAVKALLTACFAFFLIQHTADQFFGMNLLSWLALTPSSFMTEHRLWQLVTYSFLHGDVMHLFLNLMMLLFIGGELEGVWGTVKFLKFYFFCTLAAAILYLVLQVFARGGSLHAPMVGASGAIYGLLMAYGLILGERVLLFMMLFPLKAKYFVWILAGIELMSTVFSGHGGLASAAHLGGMIAGFAYLWTQASISIWKKRKSSEKATQRKKRRVQPQHLKLVINNKKKVEFETTDGDDDKPTYH